MSVRYKNQPFMNNPPGAYLRRRNRQSFEGLWNRFLRKNDLRYCHTCYRGEIIEDKQGKTVEFMSLNIDPRFQYALWDLKYSSLLFAGFELVSYKQWSKAAQNNHWINKHILMPFIEAYILKELEKAEIEKDNLKYFKEWMERKNGS